MKREILFAILALALVASGNATKKEAPSTSDKDSPLPDTCSAKRTALRTVTCMFFDPRLDELNELIDPNCAFNDRKPGPGETFVAGFRQGFEALKQAENIVALDERFSLREIHFFTDKNVPELAKKFPSRSGLWSETQVGAHIKGALGCCIATTQLKDGQELQQVYVLVIRKVGNAPKVVFFGN